MDSKQEEITELTALLKGRLIFYQRFLIETELRAIRSGAAAPGFRWPEGVQKESILCSDKIRSGPRLQTDGGCF